MEKDEEIQTLDDKEAGRYCLKEGLMEELQKNPGSGFKMVSRLGHPTHYVMGCRFAGHEDPCENGLGFIALPKSKWKLLDAMNYFEGLLAGMNLENITRNEIVSGP